MQALKKLKSPPKQKLNLQDWISDFLRHEEFQVMGHSQRWEDLNLGMGWLYYGLSRLLRPQKVVVIGSWRGFSPLLFGKALQDNIEGGEVIFIDPSKVDSFWRQPRSAVQRRFASHGVRNIRHYLMTTQEFVKTPDYRKLKNIGLVMVDGYHTREQAKYDFKAFENKMDPHGILLLHDSCKERPSKIYGTDKIYQRTVKTFVDELKKSGRYQVLDLPFDDGLTLVRKETPINKGSRPSKRK